MERLFGRDLSEVRVHAGAAAADTLSARAFARGNHVYFAIHVGSTYAKGAHVRDELCNP